MKLSRNKLAALNWHIVLFWGIFLISANCSAQKPPVFDGQSAFKFLEKQCNFGPRNPGSKGHTLCKDYLIETKELSNPLILPLIEMAMPALKQATEDDKKNLLACSSLLIRADMTIKPFEFFLYALLRKHLSQADAKFSQTVFRKYKPLLNDIQFLISVLSEAGGELDRTAVTMAMQSFDPDWQVPDELPGYDASQLNKSLQRLNRLTPLLKKPLMQTLAEIVMQDGEIKTAEIELLRATGIYLESPIPPLLQ